MSWTTADRDAIKAAILQAAQGQTVTIADRSYTSQDIEDLQALLSAIEADLVVQTTGVSRNRLAAFAKGV